MGSQSPPLTGLPTRFQPFIFLWCLEVYSHAYTNQFTAKDPKGPSAKLQSSLPFPSLCCPSLPTPSISSTPLPSVLLFSFVYPYVSLTPSSKLVSQALTILTSLITNSAFNASRLSDPGLPSLCCSLETDSVIEVELAQGWPHLLPCSQGQLARAVCWPPCGNHHFTRFVQVSLCSRWEVNPVLVTSS